MAMAVAGLLVSPSAIAMVSKETLRTVNAARMRAEQFKCGLSYSLAAKCMYPTGQVEEVTA